MKVYKEVTDVIFDLDGVAALLNALSVQYMEEEQTHISDADMMKALSKLMYDVQGVADFLSNNEIAINEALGNTKKKTAGSVRRIPADKQ